MLEDELRKLDNPDDHLGPRKERKGPADSDFAGHYRSLFQDSDEAVAKGYPSHDDAIQDILEDADTSPENLQTHLNYTLFLKLATKDYRSHEGRNAIWKLYRTLCYRKFGLEPPYEPKNPRIGVENPFADDPRLTVHREVYYGPAKTRQQVIDEYRAKMGANSPLPPDLDLPDTKAQTLDAYIVKSDKPTPVVFEIHGGGWRRGYKNMFPMYEPGFFEALFDLKVSVVSLEYRMTGKYPFPLCLKDVLRAVQFVRSKAGEWNIDPDRFASIGGSAGAHLSGWIGFHDDVADPKSADPVERQSSRIRCFIEMSGPMDLTRFDSLQLLWKNSRGPDMADAFAQAFGVSVFGYDAPEVQEKARAASPFFLLTPDDPPAMIVHSAPKIVESADTPHELIPDKIDDPHSYLHGIYLADAMDKAGVKAVRFMRPEVGKDKEFTKNAKIDFLKQYLLN